MNKNPFAIRKSPVEMIAAQAVALDDYVKLIPRGGKITVRATAPGGAPIEEEPEPSPVHSCATIF